jgi:hemoglobin-like flavoprotein
MQHNDQIVLVQESFAMVAPGGEAFVRGFYARLFRRAPQLRPLFPGDVAGQADKLAKTLSIAVASLSDGIGWLAPALRQMGADHAGYGVLPSHYPLVAETLIVSFHEALGPDFTPAHEAAWQETLTSIAGLMLEGAESRKAGAA